MSEKLFWNIWRNKYLLQYIYSKLRGLDARKAAKTGNIQAFKYSVLTGFNKDVMNWAARSGHLELVKWLWKNRNEGCSMNAIIWASKFGQFPVVRFLYENVPICRNYDNWALNESARYGYIDIFKWLSCRCKSVDYCYPLKYAVEGGHLDIVQYLGEICDEKYMRPGIDVAARYGYLDLVKWFWNKYKYTEVELINCVYFAIRGNHLPVVKWLDLHIDNYGGKLDTLLNLGYIYKAHDSMNYLKWRE